jgi:hypothetical protein
MEQRGAYDEVDSLFAPHKVSARYLLQLYRPGDGIHAVQAYKVSQWPHDQWPSQAHLTLFILLVVEL